MIRVTLLCGRVLNGRALWRLLISAAKAVQFCTLRFENAAIFLRLPVFRALLTGGNGTERGICDIDMARACAHARHTNDTHAFLKPLYFFPDLFLAFLDFLAFFFCQEFLVYLIVFPFCPRNFKGSEERKNPCLFGGFPCLFFQRKRRSISCVSINALCVSSASFACHKEKRTPHTGSPPI